MSKNFLITGLPRCRTAWLTTVLLACGIDARHERYSFESMDALSEWLDGGTEEHPRGLVDGFASITYPRWALEKFKDSQIVYVHRPFDDVLKSWVKFKGAEPPADALEKMSYNYEHFMMNFPSARTTTVNYEQLDDVMTVARIIAHVAKNVTLDIDVIRQLQLFKIELHLPKCAELRVGERNYLKEIE